jgi:hypothetical protein
MALFLLLILTTTAGAADGPLPWDKGAKPLDSDKVVMVVGSSVSVRRYGVHPLPKWAGGPNRVPPQCTNGQNVFFRVFEILNDHENMHWRRLMDKDWKREGTWKTERKLPWKDASPRISYATADPDAHAEIRVPAGYEKLALIYTSDPKGDTIRVTIDRVAPKKNALVDTHQDTTVPPKDKMGPQYDTLDSHGKPIKIRRPKSGIKNIVELRTRYPLDPKKEHTIRVQRGTRDKGKRILVWGVAYWRGNCVQVVQRAKGGLNCGALPDYRAVQEVEALRPDYILLEAINIRNKPASVTKSLGPGYSWCAAQVKKGKFKVLVYSTAMASSKAFCAWFADPKHKPPYGGTAETVKPENATGCHKAVIDLCRKHNFPLVDVGKTVDAYVARHKSVKFVPHILKDWYHPNQWGAALFGRTIYHGIKKTWPELPVRLIKMPPPPTG